MDINDLMKTIENLPEEMKNELNDYIKQRGKDFFEDSDFMQKMTLEFDEHYGSPAAAYKGMMKLAAYTIYMMIRSVKRDHVNESAGLYMLSLLTPLTLMLEETGKGYHAISSTLNEIILEYSVKNPEVIREAENRHNEMIKGNAEAKKRFEETGSFL